MFKLVVLSALLAVSAARPGGLFHGSVAYTAPVAAVAAVPAAVSHQSRVDVISEPVAHVVATPVVEKVVAAPAVAYAAPAIAVPAAYSHTSRVDVHSAPVVTAYAAPAIVEKTVVAEPWAASVHAW